MGQNIAATLDDAMYAWDQDLENCSVKALFIGRNETENKIGFVDIVSPESSTVGVVLDQTNFYAEAGGQIYYIGTITTMSGATVRVDNVRLYGQYVPCGSGDLGLCIGRRCLHVPSGKCPSQTHCVQSHYDARSQSCSPTTPHYETRKRNWNKSNHERGSEGVTCR